MQQEAVCLHGPCRMPVFFCQLDVSHGLYVVSAEKSWEGENGTEMRFLSMLCLFV